MKTLSSCITEIVDVLKQIEAGDLSGRAQEGGEVVPLPLFAKLNSLAQTLAARGMEDALVVESLGIGIWKWDLLTNALEWDDNMYRLYGVDRQDFDGAYDAWENSLSAETKAKAVAEINAAVRGEKDFDTTFQVVHKTGKIQEIRTRAFVIRDQNGKPLKMHGINVDRHREAELERAIERERVKSMHIAKLASLGEMSAGIAHEVNNPLAIILGNVRLFGKFAGNPEKQTALLASIEAAGLRIQKIVSGLKKFSRSSERNDYRSHCLAAVIKEAVILTEVSSRRHGVPVTAELATEAFVLCDDVEIEQVLINLIHNGIDAVKGSEDAWVRVVLAEEADELVMRVVDAGRGISEKAAARLFEPFFTTKPVGEGTGLGLSIAKGILDEHGAKIALLAGEPHTTFEIRFKRLMHAEVDLVG